MSPTALQWAPAAAGDGTRAEMRGVVLCADGLFAQRARLARTVFPTLRRRAAERGIVFTGVDLRRGLRPEHAVGERLRRLWMAELRQETARAIVLLAPDAESEPGADLVRQVVEDLVRAEPASARRVTVYVTSETAAAAADRAAMRAVRSWAAGLGVVCRDARAGESEAARMVLEDLAAAIETVEVTGERGPLERERRAHEEYAASRRLGAAPRRAQMVWLERSVADGEQPILIVGAPGSGRSTLVAQWAAAHRQRHPAAFLLLHHVGVVNAAETWRDVVARIAREVTGHSALAEAEGVTQDDAFEPGGLALLLAHAAAMGATLVIDGAERLAEGASLEWLPRYVPPGLRLIVTSTTAPADAALRSGWAVMELAALTLTERRAFAEHFARGRSEATPPVVRAAIDTDPALSTPLAVRLALDDSGAAQAGSGAGATTLDGLMQAALDRLEAEFSAAVVGGLLTALLGARRGLTRSEAQRAMPGVTEFVLADLLAAIDLHLIVVDGCLRFHHDAFRRAVRERYLPDDTDVRALHARLARLFSPAAASRPVGADGGGTGAMDRAAMDRAAIVRCAEEAPWHFRRAGDARGLRACLENAGIMLAFIERDLAYELIALWNDAGGPDEMVAACKAAVEAAASTAAAQSAEAAQAPTVAQSVPSAERAGMMAAFGSLLRHAARYTEALVMLRDAAEVVERECPHELGLRGTVAANLADLLFTLGQLEEAERWGRAALEAFGRLHDGGHIDLADALGDLAEVLLATGRRAEAVEHYRAALRMVETIGAGDPHIATAANNLACALRDLGQHDEAEALFRRALAMWRGAGGADHPNAAAIMNNLAVLLFDRGAAAAANAMRGEVAGAWERMLGPNHPMVATALSNWATGIARNDPATALTMLERALEIHTAAHPEPTHDTAVILYSVGRAQFHAGRLDEAEDNLRRAYDLQRELFGPGSAAVATTLAGLGMVLRERGDLLMAEQLLTRSLDTFRTVLGDRHLAVGTVLGNLAEVAARQQDRALARERALAALDILEAFEARDKVAELRALLASLGGAGADR